MATERKSAEKSRPIGFELRCVYFVVFVRFVSYVSAMNKSRNTKTNRGPKQGVTNSHSPFPEPNDLLSEAHMEIGHSDLKSYATVIATLRKKGFSFREIAEWLNARSVPTNHNAVYRIFTTCLAPGQADEIEEDLDHLKSE
ncbi:MAG: hypothetical protein RIQ71_2198 [Verrucomicrobiota bacterium]|jgi:hypothetical protein